MIVPLCSPAEMKASLVRSVTTSVIASGMCRFRANSRKGPELSLAVEPIKSYFFGHLYTAYTAKNAMEYLQLQDFGLKGGTMREIKLWVVAIKDPKVLLGKGGCKTAHSG